ncbi:putative Regulatory protein MarR [Desulfamplus magnetovallimortis]|uniref:Putative Regulatory protein MarR n=1 Tax=Desulfamplus magnetovallimortis TaxID=1246637 RepID=A0A1W1HC86_9BACT|nr:winged helix-turn-helix transcriptional regulator [Desulfamplus magnetovallimortis]SLM30111.1 putative Regulatory protein MarR [Desulfamplus magnetovallimortis]
MIEPYNAKYLSPSKEFRRLSLLLQIKENSNISQHTLADRSHLSSSMVNVYIREMTEEELLTVSGNSNRTISYHLTEKGNKYLYKHFLAFSAETVQIYASVKREITRLLKQFESRGIRTLVLYGASDTAEIVNAAIQQTRLVVIGVIDSDPAKQGQLFNNGTIIQSPENLSHIAPDAVLITSFARQNEIHENIEKLGSPDIKILKLANI